MMSEVIYNKVGNTLCGDAAHIFYKKENRGILQELEEAARHSGNKFFVIERSVKEWIVRAAQSTRDGAMHYMTEGRHLVNFESMQTDHMPRLLKKSDAALERMLALIQKQIKLAADAENDKALAWLQQRESEVIQARVIKNFGE